MDASSSVLDVQRKSLHNEEDIDNCKDRISDLPEAILCHILSYLSTRDAVRTGILSTKWKCMWTSVTNLHFEDHYFSRTNKTQRSKFITFVERVLLLHENPTILKFSLHCYDIYDASHIKTWITAVIRRKKVQMLDICYNDESFVFLPCLFGCDSLIELKLQMPCIIRVPNYVHFSRLKIVELNRVVLSAFLWIVFSFPVIEVFKLIECVWMNVKLINMDAPLLKSFVIRNSTYRCLLDVTRIRNSTMGWMLDTPGDCMISICGQSLTNFECNSNFTEDIILPKPSLVSNALVKVADNFHRDGFNKSPTVGVHSWLLLKQLCSVEYLTISNDIIKALSHPELLATLPTFEKLTQLEVSSFVSFDRALVELLQTSPVLESLTFAKRI